MKTATPAMTREDLDGRLNCFGEFDECDQICLKSCALNINCAIAKSKFLGFHLLEDSSFPFSNTDYYEAE